MYASFIPTECEGYRCETAIDDCSPYTRPFVPLTDYSAEEHYLIYGEDDVPSWFCRECSDDINSRIVQFDTYLSIASALINAEFSGLEYEAEDGDDEMLRLARAIIKEYGYADDCSMEGWYGTPNDDYAYIHDNMYGDIVTYTFKAKE